MLGFQALGRRALGQISTDVAVSAEAGAFTLTGQAAGLSAAIIGGTGAFTLTGQDAAFTISANYPLTADAGTFTLSGQDATLVYGRVIPFVVEPGAFVLSGGAATFAITMPAGAGVFVLTGQDTRRLLALSAGRGAFSLAGSATVNRRDLVLYANPTQAARVEYVLAAPLGAVAIGQGSTFDATATTFSFHGQDVRFQKAVTLTAGTGTFTLSGQDATLATSDYPSNIKIFPRVGRGPRGFSLGGGAAARVSVGSGPRIRIAGG